MTALQLESELEEIEERMISQISLICDTYQLQDHTAPRNLALLIASVNQPIRRRVG